MPMLRSALFALVLVATPALANPAIDKHLDAMAEATTEQGFYAAAQNLIALGPDAIPDLTERLLAAGTEDERIDLTFLLGSVIGQARFQDMTVEISDALVDEVATLLHQPADIVLEGNLANLAGHIEPQPPAITEGLLSLLARAENEGLRATTSAVIALYGNETALPLVHDALRQSPSDTFSGDVALILRGTELPDDVAEIFVALLASEDAEARQSASRLLDDAGIADPGQLDAALRDLEVATTDMQLLNAAMAVRNHTDGSPRVADALERAMGVARRLEERHEIIRAFGASGEIAHARLAEIIVATTDADILSQLMLGTGTSPDLRESPAIAQAYITIMAEADDTALVEQARFGVVQQGETAREGIEARLAGDDLSPEIRDQFTAILQSL